MLFLHHFITILMDSGLKLSIGDRIDAEQAIVRYPPLLKDKEKLRAGLRSLLIRNMDDLSTFDFCFDAFFAHRALDGGKLGKIEEFPGRVNGKDANLGQESSKSRSSQATGTMHGIGGSFPAGNLSDFSTFTGTSGQGGNWFQQLVGETKLSNFLDWISENYRKAANDLLENNVRAAADNIYQRITRTSATTKKASRELKGVENNFFSAIRNFKRSLHVDRGLESQEIEIMEKILKKRTIEMIKAVKKAMLEQGDFPQVEVLEDISWTTEMEEQQEILNIPFDKINADLEQIKREIKTFGKKLASLESRKRRLASRGKLNIRRTIRCNIKNGGVLVDLKVSRKKIRDPYICLLNDISGSTGWISEFFFTISYSLQHVFKKINIYEFDSTIADVTPALKCQSVEKALKKRTECWRKPVGVRQGHSNYETAFDDLINTAWAKLDKKTTVVILGDCRDWYGRWRSGKGPLSGEPISKIKLKKIKNRVKRVIILNPEPKRAWNSGDSVVSHFKDVGAEIYHVSTIRELTELVYKF